MCARDEYMPSKTERNDEHFRASLIIPPSVTSCCPGLFLSFLFLFSRGPDHNECKQSPGVIFLQSCCSRCFTEEYSVACVCAFSFHSDLLTLIPEVSLSGLLYPHGGSGKVPKCPVLLWIIIQIPKGILTIFALPRSSVPWRRLRLLAADLCVGEHWKIWLRAPRLARNLKNGNT